MTKKKMRNKIESVTKKVVAKNYRDQIFNELAILAMLGRESEWELENTIFKGFSYDDSLEFIEKLQKRLVAEVNSPEKNYTYLQLYRIIESLSIIGLGNEPKITKKNPKVKFLVKFVENISDRDLKENFKMVSLLDR